MRHHIFQESDRYKIAVLLKNTAFNKQEIQANYITPLNSKGVVSKDLIAFTLDYNDQGKAPAGFVKSYLGNLLPALDSIGVTHLYVTDATYFKVLTKQTRAEPHFGYVLPCKFEGYEHLQVVLGLNYQSLIYNPELQAKLTLSLDTLASVISGSYQALGSGIIHSAQYPKTVQEIAQALDSLHKYPELTADIEAFSLRFNEAGIGTCAFAWDEHNGMAFACDYQPAILEDGRFHPDCPAESGESHHGFYRINKEVRRLLLNFLVTYKGSLTWHNAAYDVKVIIYTLWMEDLLNTAGLLDGLAVMTRDFHDTKIIAYLATNSTAGNVLGLKSLAHEFAGNWAKDDIKDIRKIPLKDLLQYNLVDALSTFYIKKKYTPIMVADNQERIYFDMMLPSLMTIIQMELTGMPMDAATVLEAKAELERQQQEHLKVITDSQVIKMLNLVLQENAWTNDYEARKAKAVNPGKILPKPKEAFSDLVFNPNSGPQLQRLLYEQMGLPVIDFTDTKQPATGADTIEKLINHTQEPAYKAILSALIHYGKVTKILSTFIPAFERGIDKADGRKYLHGSFNLGGTISGRLSSSDPNLQNLPSGSTFGKLIKKCFKAPDGWLLTGADFSSLEDYISALTTKDPNKLAVYEDGFDGHCLRAYAYFKDELPEVRQAESTERCFEIKINGQTLMAKSGDLVILPDGTKMPIEAYYDSNSRL